MSFLYPSLTSGSPENGDEGIRVVPGSPEETEVNAIADERREKVLHVLGDVLQLVDIGTLSRFLDRQTLAGLGDLTLTDHFMTREDDKAYPEALEAVKQFGQQFDDYR